MVNYQKIKKDLFSFWQKVMLCWASCRGLLTRTKTWWLVSLWRYEDTLSENTDETNFTQYETRKDNYSRRKPSVSNLHALKCEESNSTLPFQNVIPSAASSALEYLWSGAWTHRLRFNEESLPTSLRVKVHKQHSDYSLSRCTVWLHFNIHSGKVVNEFQRALLPLFVYPFLYSLFPFFLFSFFLSNTLFYLIFVILSRSLLP